MAGVHVRAWQEGYRGLMPAEYLEGLRAEDRARRYTFGRDAGPRTTVATRDGAIVGFATLSGSELVALNVDPNAWRSGVGAALIAAARREIARGGAEEAHLWILAGNTRAQRFYEWDGWALDGGERVETVWGITVPQLRLRRRL